MRRLACFWLTACLLCDSPSTAAENSPSAVAPRVLLPHAIPLRSQEEREWDEFPAVVGNRAFEVWFSLDEKAIDQRSWSLQIRHADVKQFWDVSLNGEKIGRLERDENLQVSTFDLPAQFCRPRNRLRIEPANHRSSDDISLGEIVLYPAARSEWLTQSNLRIRVRDDNDAAIPARITVTRLDGTLAAVANQSRPGLAVRTGVLYSLDGAADVQLAAGEYWVYATRGMEWSLGKQRVTVAAGQSVDVPLSLRRAVPTAGWVACDTHVHTLTFSGHGDSSIEERMATIAGEGIELPIATDHNVHINYQPYAAKVGADRYFTPVIGNEVTTRLGHFNVFPIRDGAPIPNHQADDWDGIFQSIYATPDVRIAILNHARDVHSGFRPFGPENHIAIAGENYQGWNLQANAMEVINSAATQTDPYRLFHDWLGLLNGGRRLTPIGCSDSHDVARHFIGQGRTYVRVDDDSDAGQIDVDEAVASLVAGRVSVSYGLYLTIQVDGEWGIGDLVPSSSESRSVEVTVYGPDWVRAERVRLFANGQLVGTQEVPAQQRGASGRKHTAQWTVPPGEHDLHLVAIADGPGVTAPYWPMAKAYQPTSTAWSPRARAITGAVWLDRDGSKSADSPRDYAVRLVKAHSDDLPELLSRAAQFDPPTQVQVARALREQGVSPLSESLLTALKQADPQVQRSFEAYREAWRAAVAPKS